MSPAAKTLLVLGASEGQLPAYREARRLGLRTIGVDQNPSAVAAREADEFVAVCTRRPADIRRAVGDRAVAGVVSPASDASALSVRALSRWYGTGHVLSRAAARASLDKVYFRKVVDGLGLPTYRWAAGRDCSTLRARVDGANEVPFPLVVKPADGSGSKGINVLVGGEGLGAAIGEAQSFSLDGRVIVEQFVEGDHYTVECVIRGHRPAFMAVIRRTVTPPPAMITLEQLVPADLSDATLGRLRAQIGAVCRAVDLDRGPLNVDFVVDRSGRVRLVEMAARPGGNGIARLVQHAYGVNLTEAAIRSAIGDPVVVEATRSRAVLVRILQAPADGVVTALEGAATVAAMPECLELELFAGVGSSVRAYTQAGHKLGYLAVAAADAPSARAALDRALGHLEIGVTPADDRALVAA